MARTWVRRLAKISGYGILVLLALAALALTFTVGWSHLTLVSSLLKSKPRYYKERCIGHPLRELMGRTGWRSNSRYSMPRSQRQTASHGAGVQSSSTDRL